MTQRLAWVEETDDDVNIRYTGLSVDERVQGSGTTFNLAELFISALILQQQKASTYGEAWRDQGWAGNVSRVLSKASRLRNMLWRDQPIESDKEPVVETLLDMINLAAFAIINYNAKNRWGNRE